LRLKRRATARMSAALNRSATRPSGLAFGRLAHSPASLDVIG
jgi:hypothetical protein